jgi:hypothetical protein
MAAWRAGVWSRAWGGRAQPWRAGTRASPCGAEDGDRRTLHAVNAQDSMQSRAPWGGRRLLGDGTGGAQRRGQRRAGQDAGGTRGRWSPAARGWGRRLAEKGAPMRGAGRRRRGGDGPGTRGAGGHRRRGRWSPAALRSGRRCAVQAARLPHANGEASGGCCGNEAWFPFFLGEVGAGGCG